MNDNRNAFTPYEPSADIAAALAFGAAWPGARVLEIGCGLGDDALLLAEAGCRVTAFDLSEICIAHARSRHNWLRGADPIKSKCTFSVGDHLTLSKLARANRTFDLVSDRLVFSNIGNQRIRTKYLRDIAHLIRRGGLFFLRVGSSPLPSNPVATDLTKTDKAILKDLFQSVGLRTGRNETAKKRAAPILGKWMPMLPHRGGYTPAAGAFLLEAKNLPRTSGSTRST
ncbi:class I SAM-dependent methyltransferase [Corallococcus exiguus]|uniref:Methyltransferase domain-containing protein n=1 Tax=Corallococcus exiguus TaxID=83462 RepID=A0A7X4Y9P0_9BACT|nr:class I SAM-dependent methyltransferase [Corallococcus exiguus]NBC41408.1 methyltransferase domain-containing protein [Corallococcus exiguus]TNV67115.1 class I SAM-dependent methyltransferase [Corallococcus exiguus]